MPAKVLLLMEPQFLFGGNDRLTVGLFPVTFITFFFVCVINPAVAQSTDRVNIHVLYPETYLRLPFRDSDGTWGQRASSWKEKELRGSSWEIRTGEWSGRG